MIRKLLALMVTLLLLPAAAMADTAALPFGLAFGLDTPQTEAAFAADETLAALTWQRTDYGNGVVEYLFENVLFPDTDLTASSLSVQVDLNNSEKAERLTLLSFSFAAPEDGIGTFRTLLTVLTDSLGAPESDPFDEYDTAQYVEWGTLSASWTTEAARISLNLSRMYEESVSVQFTSRINYSATDLD